MSTESISKMGLCRSNYADDKSFINAIQEEVTRAVPPTKMTFSSKEQLDSFAKTALGLAGDRVITNHLFSCKLANLGLSLNLKDEEIKGLDADEYPITLTAKTFDDVLDFSVAYQAATPVKRVTSKGSKVPYVSAKLSFTRKEKIIIAIAFLAVIVILPFYNFVSTKIEEKQARELQEQYNSERRNMYQSSTVPDWVYGTWTCTTSYGTETIKIDKWEIADLSYGSYKTASYSYEDGMIKAKFPGEGGIVTVFRVDLVGRRIEYGDGIYMHKR